MREAIVKIELEERFSYDITSGEAKTVLKGARQEALGLYGGQPPPTEVTRAMAGQRLSLDEPFLGELTLGQYLQLPDEERSRLWDSWGQIDLDALEELDVRPDEVLAR